MPLLLTGPARIARAALTLFVVIGLANALFGIRGLAKPTGDLDRPVWHASGPAGWVPDDPAGASDALSQDDPSLALLPLVARSVEVHRLPPPDVTPPRPTTTSTAARTTAPTRTVTRTTAPTPTATSTTPPSPAATDTRAPRPTDPAAQCGAVPTFADGAVPARVVHVAPGGSDSSGDGSAARPFATIRRAAQGAGPGTAVRVHAGTYAGGTYLEGLRGSASAPIWIGGAPGEAPPVIQGASEGLHLTRVSYLVVHDLEVRGATGNGINIDDGGDTAGGATHHVLVQGVHIRDIGTGGNQDCLKLSGVDDYFVLDSTFRACGAGGSAIDHVGCHRGLIARSRFADMAGNAVQTKGGSADIEVRANHFQSAGARAANMGGSTGFEFFRPPLSADRPNAEARDIRVVANVLEGSDAPLAFVGCVDCLAANNTIVDPTRWVLRILQETTSTGSYQFEPAGRGRFVNNLVYFRRARLSTFANVGPNTAAGTFTFAHNLWFAHDDPARSRPDLPAAETNAVVGRDPLLAPDFRIDARSPAAGAGRALPEVRADFGGACFRETPSIGAFEVRGGAAAGPPGTHGGS